MGYSLGSCSLAGQILEYIILCECYTTLGQAVPSAPLCSQRHRFRRVECLAPGHTGTLEDLFPSPSRARCFCVDTCLLSRNCPGKIHLLGLIRENFCGEAREGFPGAGGRWGTDGPPWIRQCERAASCVERGKGVQQDLSRAQTFPRKQQESPEYASKERACILECSFGL